MHGYDASLRIWSDTITASAIAIAFAPAAPTRLARQGDAKRPGQPFVHDHDCVWLDSPLPRDAALERHLEWICAAIEPAASGFAAIRASCDADIFCGVRVGDAQGGFALPAALLGRLAALNLPVKVDVFRATA